MRIWVTYITFAAIVVLYGAFYASGADEKKPAAAAADKAKVAKPETVTREQWGSTPQDIPETREHIPKYITIHHAGVDWKTGRDPKDFLKSMQAWGQKEKGWPDLAYHYMIAPDGRIFECRPVEYEPESNTKYDLKGHLGIEMMGNFETQRPSEAQLKSVVALTAWLCQEHKIDPSQIAGHKDRAKDQTVCPGKDFVRYLDDGTFVKWVKATLAGEKPEVKSGPPLPDGPKVVVDTQPESL